MNKVLSIACIVLFTASSNYALASGDSIAGKAKSASCVACHGADGNSAIAVNPKLAGQHAQYIAKQLLQYKSGERVNAVMQGMAANLSDQDIEDIAAYFSEQKPAPGIADADAEVVKLGESIYRGGITSQGIAACAACHGPNGRGNPVANYPTLAGQHAEYTISTLKAFRQGVRNNDANKMMRLLTERMTDREIEAVSEYIQGLK